MNDNTDSTENPFYKRVAKDDGVQRAAASVCVALVVAVAKEALFSR